MILFKLLKFFNDLTILFIALAIIDYNINSQKVRNFQTKFRGFISFSMTLGKKKKTTSCFPFIGLLKKATNEGTSQGKTVIKPKKQDQKPQQNPDLFKPTYPYTCMMML